MSALERILVSKPYLSDEEFTSACMVRQCGNTKGGVNFALAKAVKDGLVSVRKGQRGKLKMNIYKRKKRVSFASMPLVSEPSPIDTYPTGIAI